MHSKLYSGTVMHHRHSPVDHKFVYKHNYFAFDLSELEWINQNLPFLGYNRTRLLSLNDRDYLHGKSDIMQEIRKALNLSDDIEQVMLFTSPRYLNYSFNPVNFYLAFKNGELDSALAEVNNTFGDRHIYPLRSLRRKANSNTWESEACKAFHVSPFNPIEGEYLFRFHLDSDGCKIEVNLHNKGTAILSTYISGRAQELNKTSIYKYIISKPLDTTLNNIPRILIQAGILYAKKKLAVYKRPNPVDPNTIINRDLAG